MKKPKKPKQEFSFDSDKYVAVVYGSRGEPAAIFHGDDMAYVEHAAIEAWTPLMDKFAKRDTGAPPIWDIYERVR